MEEGDRRRDTLENVEIVQVQAVARYRYDEYHEQRQTTNSGCKVGNSLPGAQYMEHHVH